MSVRRTRRPRPPLDGAALNELALAYVGRFATTRAKLADYLARKLRERGWAGVETPDPRAIAERLAAAGLIDDAAFASVKAESLGRRGYGRRRVGAALSAAGIDEEDRAPALASAREGAVAAALRFAERRRLGPYAAAAPADRRERERSLAAMLRAGHPLDLSRAVIDLPPGAIDVFDALTERFSHTRE